MIKSDISIEKTLRMDENNRRFTTVYSVYANDEYVYDLSFNQLKTLHSMLGTFIENEERYKKKIESSDITN